ncbi:MAG: PEP-CTERM sorting domain-containing protein [Pirellulales bacterium]
MGGHHFFGISGNRIVGEYNDKPFVYVIPEPSAFLLAILGAGGLFAFVRRFRRASIDSRGQASRGQTLTRALQPILRVATSPYFSRLVSPSRDRTFAHFAAYLKVGGRPKWAVERGRRKTGSVAQVSRRAANLRSQKERRKTCCLSAVVRRPRKRGASFAEYVAPVACQATRILPVGKERLATYGAEGAGRHRAAFLFAHSWRIFDLELARPQQNNCLPGVHLRPKPIMLQRRGAFFAAFVQAPI